MINGREPNYICLDTRTLTLAKRLPDSERLKFFDGLCAAYSDKLNGNASSALPDDMTGDLIRQAAATMIDGFDRYMGRVNANPTGKKTNGNPMGSQWVANDNPPNTQWVASGTQSNQDQINKDQIIQIKSDLKEAGYTDAEINDALTRCDGKTIRNLPAYIRQTIDNQRRDKKTGKHVSSQNYTQRDYSGEDEEAMRRMLEMQDEYN